MEAKVIKGLNFSQAHDLVETYIAYDKAEDGYGVERYYMMGVQLATIEKQDKEHYMLILH